MIHKTITRNGQQVECYGNFSQEDTLECVFEDELHDGYFDTYNCKNWTEAVEELSIYAKEHGTELLQLTVA